MAVILAGIGFLATAATIVLSAIPSPDDANPPLAVAKVLLSTLTVILTGFAIFAVGRRRKVLDH